ncbi:hypothetical protein LCGC14_1790910 [marine sediment metagenome]|uniref:Isochorismatase-like domain-containing protein n=1 Tax=marine sediment metagenome TaxID=412755 RepID=A0A0F9GSL1_9ZZZZ
MPLIDAATSHLLMIDFQDRLMPAIDGAQDIIANARRLSRAVQLLDIAQSTTEQCPDKLGATVAALTPPAGDALAKASFNALGAPRIAARLAGDQTLVVCGCETHVCVLQTVLGLRALGRTVHVVADATGSRRADNRAAGLARMAQAGAEIVTTEMVLFEWLGRADHPAFRSILAMIR